MFDCFRQFRSKSIHRPVRGCLRAVAGCFARAVRPPVVLLVAAVLPAPVVHPSNRAMLVAALLPARFLALMAHLVATAVLLYMMFAPVQVSLPAPQRTSTGAWNDELQREAYRSARYDLFHVVGWTFGCLLIELVSLFTSATSSLPRLMLCNVVAHTCGGFFTVWMTLDGWTYVAAIVLFVLFALLPAIAEGVVMATHVFSNLDRKRRHCSRVCSSLCESLLSMSCFTWCSPRRR